MRMRKHIQEMENSLSGAAKIADALGHPIRLEIIRYLTEKKSVRNDVCNSELVANLPVSQATVSQHVKRLVNADLLIVNRENTSSYYSVNRQALTSFLDELKEFVK